MKKTATSERPLSAVQVGLKEGFRSGLEDLVAEQLEAAGIPVQYETFIIPFIQPERTARYTPDFPLPNGIIVETKGRFVTADRQKMALIKEQCPELDIRFVFSNPNTRISKRSKTTYAMWCEKHGYRYAKKLIPVEWLQEPANSASLAAIKRMEDAQKLKKNAKSKD